MPDLSTTYLGLKLQNPLIVGSSGLTATATGVREAQYAGAGAVVLKSLFEEEIAADSEAVLKDAQAKGLNLASYDYYDYELRGERLAEYAALIADAKRSVLIPVIASVNCTWSHEWAPFAAEVEKAGADALELNLFSLAADLERPSEVRERTFLSIVERVRAAVRIPVAVKIGQHATALGRFIQQLSRTGVQGLVLFNRPFAIDFDVERMAVTAAGSLSSPAEAASPLRWVALMAGRVSCDLCASTGVHDGTAVVKQLLAGAKAVEVVSALYRGGTGNIKGMLGELSAWMDRHGFASVESFRGRMSRAASEDPAAFERVQYLKRYGR
ncbi:MAG: diguanylate cyclase [Spirochaetes bacterium RBG_13_68_11]|nr:MAG: diguanylate cyclase [Spirochaetes bacterium RBG_13_68_11]